MAGDDHGRTSIQLGCCVQHMLYQWHACQTLQHFGQAAFHAGAFAGGHHDDINGKRDAQAHGSLSEAVLSSVSANKSGLSPDCAKLSGNDGLDPLQDFVKGTQ
jgi:hypothetical protein